MQKLQEEYRQHRRPHEIKHVVGVDTGGPDVVCVKWSIHMDKIGWVVETPVN